jgi:hypothetical protein
MWVFNRIDFARDLFDDTTFEPCSLGDRGYSAIKRDRAIDNTFPIRQ